MKLRDVSRIVGMDHDTWGCVLNCREGISPGGGFLSIFITEIHLNHFVFLHLQSNGPLPFPYVRTTWSSPRFKYHRISSRHTLRVHFPHANDSLNLQRLFSIHNPKYLKENHINSNKILKIVIDLLSSRNSFKLSRREIFF